MVGLVARREERVEALAALDAALDGVVGRLVVVQGRTSAGLGGLAGFVGWGEG